VKRAAAGEPSAHRPSARAAALLWLAAGAAPVLLVASEGAGRKGFAACALWALGALLLARALRSDTPRGHLAALRASGAGVLAVAVALVAAQAAALALPATLVVFGALLGATGFVALLALCASAERFVRLVRGAALAAAAFVVAAALGEIVCRLPPVVARTGGHRPGILRWEAEHDDGLWSRNPLGLRSRHTDAPKPPGTAQILALGDDATFGVLVARSEDTWPSALETGLIQDGVAVEVVNAGQRAFTTANEAEWLARVGFRFEPDLLVVQFSLNDAVPSTPGFGAERSFYLYRLRPLLPGLHADLERRSYLYSALDSFKEHQEMRWLHPEGFRPLYEEGMPGWGQAREALAAIGAFARARHIQALLVLFPDLEPDTDLRRGAYRYAGVHAKVRAAAESAGLGVLDLYDAFAAAGRPSEAWWTLPCEPKPGAEAQRLAAHAIHEAIAERGLLAHAR
jgi:hypothetical protein